jgi:hypothetical protein
VTTAPTRGARGRASWRLLPALCLLAALPACGRDNKVSLSEIEKQQESDRVGSIEEQGGTVSEKSYPPYGTGYVVNLSGARINHSTFKNLKALKRVAELDLSKSSITDDQMEQLNEVANLLVRLDLSRTAVTDAGLAKLTNTYVLFNLNVVGTEVTAAGVERFKQLRLASPYTRVKQPNVKLK